jgi:tetratricopeptide (TPR) repeat protein
MQETMLDNQTDSSVDQVESSLRTISQNILVFAFGLLPIFFLPVLVVPLPYLKVVFVICLVLLSAIFFSLAILRSGKIQLRAPGALYGLWGCVLVATISALLSGDMRDAFLGDDLGVHTVVFLLLMALVATIFPLLGHTKTTIMRLYILLTGSALLLAVFHLIRIVTSPEILTFGVFTNIVATPVGGWNDLALFFGLSILLSLVALEQLPLTKWGKGFFTAVVALSILMLAIVNFFAVWVVLGLVSLVVLMYTLTKERFSEKTLTLEGKHSAVSVWSVILSVCVCMISVTFIIGGGVVGAFISQFTDISYVEVRPSFEATTDIARNVYRENALLGIGPNKFIDAWRLYKDPSINQTLFWSTDFLGGSGYATTFAVTTGVLGATALLLFFGFFLYSGFKMLFATTRADRFWYFIGTSSFVGAAYLWGMTFFYVPGVAVMLLAAVFTGIMCTAYGALIPSRSITLSIAANKRAGFVLVAIVMIVIVGASGCLYIVGKQYSAAYTYGNALRDLQNGTNIAKAETDIANAYTASHNEAYALQLATFELAKINAYAAVGELTQVQQQELDASVRTAITAARIAVEKDPTDSLSWSTLGSIWSMLAGASVEGTAEQAAEAFSKARSFDANNPLYPLLQAQLHSRQGDLQGARVAAEEAIRLKSNFADALMFLTQIDIAEGKTDAAITNTQAVVSLEPNNPARYYQLGVLYAASGKVDLGIDAFEQAVRLDTNYANARYQLALLLASQNNVKEAVEHLQVVLGLNPGNAEIQNLITRLESGEPLQNILGGAAVGGGVVEPERVTAVDDAVTTTEDPETSLIAPVNVVNTPNTETTQEETATE